MKEAFSKIFSQMKWHEYLFIGLCYAVVLVLGIVFKSDAATILNSIFGITGVFFTAKGIWLGSFVGIAQYVCYCIMSLGQGYYGEILVSALVLIPLNVKIIISWLKNQHSNQQIKINDHISAKHLYLIAAATLLTTVGIYFLLRAFNTSRLVLSTIVAMLTILGAYFASLRTRIVFLFYITNNIATNLLWVPLALEGNLSVLPTIFNYFVYIGINFYGLYTWTKLKAQDSHEIIMKAIKTNF